MASAVKTGHAESPPGIAILMRVLSSSNGRTAILRNAQRMVSKVAVRQIERFGAAPGGAGRPSCKEQAELTGLPTVAGAAVKTGCKLHVLDKGGGIDLFVEHFCPAWQIGDDEAYVAALHA